MSFHSFRDSDIVKGKDSLNSRAVFLFSSDPYVVLKYGGVTLETSILKSTLNPCACKDCTVLTPTRIWNETFQFDVFDSAL